MRLIGIFSEEKEAHQFCHLLSEKGKIACSYEAFQDAETKKHVTRVWVENEEDFAVAHGLYERYRKNPQDFFTEEAPLVQHAPAPSDIPAQKKRFRIKVSLRPREVFSLTLTNFLLAVCVILFFWNGVQEVKMVDANGPLSLQLGLTPLEQVMVFDYPHAYDELKGTLETMPLKEAKDLKELPAQQQQKIEQIEKIPSWKGALAYFFEKKHDPSPPLFEKIRQGQVWRFFTPIVMHRGFLHILFNMAWLWILGRQIEERIGKKRLLFLILIVACITNTLQYFVSGPFFLGFSGVVVGMAGFIWMRQKVAPWEGYPLQKSTALFVLIFVLAMFALELFSFALQMFTQAELTANIANTAHIIGGLIGLFLGKLAFFSRIRNHEHP